MAEESVVFVGLRLPWLGKLRLGSYFGTHKPPRVSLEP